MYVTDNTNTRKSALPKLDPQARVAFLDTMRRQVESLSSSEYIQPSSPGVVKLEEMPVRETGGEMDDDPEPVPGSFLKRLLNDTTMPH